MEEDFDLWYRREHPRVLAVCAALSGDVSAAADAADEAFVRALERWPSVSEMASPGGWVQVVALNHLRRVLRRRQGERLLHARRPIPQSEGRPAGLPDMDLWAAVAALPRRQRLAVVLRYVHDLPEAAIAAVMGISRGSVASTLAAAQANLRRTLTGPSDITEPEFTKEAFNG
jgi:RNA polymerase sigma factor (sigma-70 family)